ncbi:MAG: DUF2975 domain-containing protein [Lachnospiraceae bacterium]|nr:DUF2975 domain-containing protein [Lachnospiraceae bacterium]
MSQRGLANLLKAAIVGVGICGLAIYFYFLPSIGKAVVQYAPEYERCCQAWILFAQVTAIPCYLVLACCWRVASEIGRDNSFSAVNARLLKYIAGLAAFDSVLLLAGNFVFYVLGMNHSGLMLLSVVVVFFGIAVTVAASALSHLVYKAASLREENELTI